MGAPQIVFIVLFAMDLGMALGLHGKPRESRYNFWTTAIADAIHIALLYWGGFWS